MQNILAWIALGIFFAGAIGIPLMLVGVDQHFVWPIALIFSAGLIAARPGGTAEKCLSFLCSWGLVFSIWCVVGFLLVIFLGFIFSNLGPPDSLFIVAFVGLYGVYREVQSSRRKVGHKNTGA